MAQLGLNLGYLLVQIVCFFIIFIVVRVWIVKPLQGMLERRRKTIAQGLEDARVSSEARANAEKEAAGIVSEAQVKAAHLISEATERADATMLEVRAEADNEIAKEREAVLAEVQQERGRMLVTCGDRWRRSPLPPRRNWWGRRWMKSGNMSFYLNSSRALNPARLLFWKVQT